MSILMSIFLGIVQGVAEFLPISSSGHLSILQNLLKLKYSEEGHLLFDVLLHLGTLISIFIVYRDVIRAMITDSIDFLRSRSDADPDETPVLRPTVRSALFVLVGTIPLVLALLFSDSVEQLFYNTGFIGFALIVTGGLLYVSDKFVVKGTKTEKNMTLKDAVIIGLAQAVAVIPGLSRAGTTIVVGLTRGLDRNYAMRFSLLLSIPAVLGSAIVTLFTALRDGVDFSLLPVYLIGFAISAAVGCLSITILRRIMAKGSFGNFAYYCWGVGALTIILSIIL